MHRAWLSIVLAVAAVSSAMAAEPAPAAPELVRDVLPLVKHRCVKCHGPAKQEAGLNLSTAESLARGGENGAVVIARDLNSSLMWQRVNSDEMPPEDPLSAEEKAVLRRWIEAGAAGLPAASEIAADPRHWSFRHLQDPQPPQVKDVTRARAVIDRFVLAELESRGLAMNPEADRATLIRRVSFDLTGLPPEPPEVRAFVSDTAADAYERMVDRYLASPHYGERWGKYWLDAAGYADSNGYFNADSDRPLAYRYRDWVVRAVNDDKPLDRFIVEQIAGDELSGFVPNQDATPEIIELLTATHLLRNSQDGTGESDGNGDELRIDRYSVLDGTSQIIASSLLGLTTQCAKCHDHKFEPITQRDYYQLQAIFYPAFNVESWQKPNERFVYANLPGELARWEAHSQSIDREVAALRSEFAEWVRANRPASSVLFHDEFDDAGPPLAEQWSNTAPGDDAPGGAPPVQLDVAEAPGAARRAGTLAILESGAAGDRWLSTRQAFDWTPEQKDQWIQVTFDLVADSAAPGGAPAARVAYFVALHDFDDNGAAQHGNILFDGNPAGGAALHVDYPGSDARPAGELGSGKYQAGHNYGVRITNIGDGKLRLEHLVDSIPDEKTVELSAEDLPDGGFGFEYCCGRSFVVDNVLVERSAGASSGGQGAGDVVTAIREKQKQLAAAVKAKEQARGEKPGKISCVVERSAEPPDVFLLTRGDPATPGEKVAPEPLSALAEAEESLTIAPARANTSSGRRLAWARWLTAPGSRPAALVARVQANRIWQHHFGRGIVATTENLGASGSPPSHPLLLEYLAARLVRGGWSAKALHREIMTSAVYRQSSAVNAAALALDPDNALVWRFSLARLDAESLRDAMLAVGGNLERRFGGPYVPTERNASGEVLVNRSSPGADRRTLYLQQRRTQTLSFLNVFDSPSIVFNCLERPVSTIPLQSLSLLNSDFVVEQAGRFAERIAREAPPDIEPRITHAFLIAASRVPTEAELRSAIEFVGSQRERHAGQADAEQQAWRDFCHMLLASNLFLYVE